MRPHVVKGIPASYGKIPGQVPAPPSAPIDYSVKKKRVFDLVSPSALSQDEIRSAVAAHVAMKPFHSSDCIQKMEFTVINPTFAHFYNVQSMMEERMTKWLCEPHIEGTAFDGIHMGNVPEPRDVIIPPAAELIDHKVRAIVPHSQHVEVCHTCAGSGQVTCFSCGGSGIHITTRTDSDGKTSTDTSICWSCGGTGRVTCGTCNGHRFVRFSLLIKAVFKMLDDKITSNARGLSEKKILKAAKMSLFEETDDFILPISSLELDDSEIVRQSEPMIAAHVDKVQKTGRLVKQRQLLCAVPMNIVFFMFNKKKGSFFVYGEDRKVFFHSYPDLCCIL